MFVEIPDKVSMNRASGSYRNASQGVTQLDVREIQNMLFKSLGRYLMLFLYILTNYVFVEIPDKVSMNWASGRYRTRFLKVWEGTLCCSYI